jgi:hypothetical protein
MFSRSKKAMEPSPAHVRPQPPAAPPAERLPQGAEAALWAIVEVIPDPRNHLALTRDPTCEVRLTSAEIAEAVAAAPTPILEPTTTPVPAATPAPRQVPRRADVRWSPDTAEVRLPVIAAPDEAAASSGPSGDASVHPIDPSGPARTDADPTRWAQGA